MNLLLEKTGPNSYSPSEIGIAILLATGFGVIIASLHLLATRDRERDDLWRPLILIAPLISIATVAVGTNLAAAFTLFGTLAIVRFRTRIRKPLDAVFVIFSVVIGLSTGNGNFMVALIGTVIVALRSPTYTHKGFNPASSLGSTRDKYTDVRTKRLPRECTRLLLKFS